MSGFATVRRASRTISGRSRGRPRSHCAAAPSSTRATAFRGRLLSGFGEVSIGLCDESGDEDPEERFAAAAGVVHELEEAEIGGQLLLRDATVRPQPGAQQGPETFGRVDVNLTEAIAIVVAGVLAAGVANGLVPITPALQARVGVVLVGVHQGA